MSIFCGEKNVPRCEKCFNSWTTSNYCWFHCWLSVVMTILIFTFYSFFFISSSIILSFFCRHNWAQGIFRYVLLLMSLGFHGDSFQSLNTVKNNNKILFDYYPYWCPSLPQAQLAEKTTLLSEARLKEQGFMERVSISALSLFLYVCVFSAGDKWTSNPCALLPWFCGLRQ